MLKTDEREMILNRETGAISYDKEIAFEQSGNSAEFNAKYEVVKVRITETKEGFLLEGEGLDCTPVHAMLSAEEYFSGKKFINNFDLKRHKEQVRELYDQVFHASSYIGFSFLAEEYSELVSEFESKQLLSIETIEAIEEEVHKAVDKDRKVEQLKNFYGEILFAADHEMTSQLEEDYAKLVEFIVNNQMLSREEVISIENEIHQESEKYKAIELYGDLHASVKEHGDKLIQVIEDKIVKDDSGKSYITQEEMEKILNKHFNEVELLLETHFKPQSQTHLMERIQQLPNKLKDMRSDLANQITTTIHLTKDIADEKVNQFRDNIDDVMQGAKSFVKRGILNVNSKVQALSNSVEQKFSIEDIKQVESVKVLAKKTKENMER